MLYLKQSTASQSVLIGPFVDSSDGTTAETGLTIANTDIRLSKNGGNLAAKNSGGATHDEAGWYTITLDATDTNTVGRLQLHCKMTGALMVFAEFQVLEETVYDALFASSAAGEFAVKLSTQGKADVNAEADTALSDYDPPTKAELDSGLAGLNDPTAAAIADAVLDEALSGHTTAGTLGKAVSDIETDATAILADTNELQTDNVPGLIAALNDPTAAAIADAVWEEAIADHSGTAGSTAEALNAAGSAGDPWTTTLPGSYTGSQAGKILADVLTDTAEIGAAGAGLTAIPWNAAWDAEVQSECTDALNAYDPPTNAEMEARTVLAATYATASALATVDTVVDGIKAKTDSLTFTTAGQVDANIQYVNDVQVTGTGASGNEWGPA